MTVAIKIEGISKMFRLFRERPTSIKQRLLVSRSRSDRRARACTTAFCSSCATRPSSWVCSGSRSTTRCWLRRCRSRSRHSEATTLRAVTIA